MDKTKFEVVTSLPQTQDCLLSLIFTLGSFEASASEAHQTLNNCFTSAPIIHHSDPSLLFLVETDASESGIGAALETHQYYVLYSIKWSESMRLDIEILRTSSQQGD